MHDSKLSFAIPLATKVKVRPFLPRGWGGGGGGGGGGAGEVHLGGELGWDRSKKLLFSLYKSLLYHTTICFIFFSRAVGLPGALTEVLVSLTTTKKLSSVH